MTVNISAWGVPDDHPDRALIERGAHIWSCIDRLVHLQRRNNLIFVLRWGKLPWYNFYTGESVPWEGPACRRVKPMHGFRSKPWVMCCGHDYSEREVMLMAEVGLVTVNGEGLGAHLTLGPTGRLYVDGPHNGVAAWLELGRMEAAGTIRVRPLEEYKIR